MSNNSKVETVHRVFSDFLLSLDREQVTDNLIKILKEESGEDVLYLTEVLGVQFIYKEIKYKEYRKIFELHRNSEIEFHDAIFNKCVLFPKDFSVNDYECMIVTSVAKAILKSSMLYLSEEEIGAYIVNHKEEVENNYMELFRTVAMVECNVQPSELDNMNNSEVIKIASNFIGYRDMIQKKQEEEMQKVNQQRRLMEESKNPQIAKLNRLKQMNIKQNPSSGDMKNSIRDKLNGFSYGK